MGICAVQTEKGELVALGFLDISAGFDTMVHLYLLKKMEIEVGMVEESREWLSSYLDSWFQYVVVGASSSSRRKMTKGPNREEGCHHHYWDPTPMLILRQGSRKL